jgi:PiT family inorganic phosphate transporter
MDVGTDHIYTDAIAMLTLLICVIIAALIFDYINGFHDAANAIATVVSTGVLPLRTAVLIAAALNFVGAISETAVAKTIASGFADARDVTQVVVLASMIGASIWNLLTWWWGLPSSSSHALIGGLAGAVVAHAGVSAFHWETLGKKFVLPLLASPALGFIGAFVLMILLLWFFRHWKPGVVGRLSRRMQFISASLMAYSHGANDAQKVMGVITLALVAYVGAGHKGVPAWMTPHGSDIPRWVIIACATAMALGTFAGGKRIIKTMGTKIIKISPLQGFAAETSAAAVLFGASKLGVPVSTTHAINACIMGVGASKRISGVRWGVAYNVMVAWILTLPASAGCAAAAYLVLNALFGKA